MVMGDHARARALRTELYRELVREMADKMRDPMNFIDGAPVFYLANVDGLLKQTELLGILDE